MMITILGAGNMGTAMAHVLAQRGHRITLWNYEGDPEPLTTIQAHHENSKYLPGIKLTDNVVAEPDAARALSGRRVVVVALPSAVIAETLVRLAPFFDPDVILVDVSKGVTSDRFEIDGALPGANQRLEKLWKQRVIISGPAVAKEVAEGHFTVMNIVSRSRAHRDLVYKAFTTPFLKLVPSVDVIGVKLCGVLKNCYAFLLGTMDGAHLPLNTKAFIVTLIMTEMKKFVVAAGGKETTVEQAAGLGDLLGTGLSPHSRNRRAGEIIAASGDVEQAIHSIGQVVEGVRTVPHALTFARKHKLTVPLLALAQKILKKPTDAKVLWERFLRGLKT